MAAGTRTARAPHAHRVRAPRVRVLRACVQRVHERVPVLTEPTPENYKYLRTKQDRMGHRLELE